VIKFLQRNRDILVFWGILIALVLLIANVWQDQLITAEYLVANKDAIQTASSIASAVILIIGALFTYYRFFRGRTFSARGQIDIQTKVHHLNEQTNLHVTKVQFKNVGSTAIFSPKLKLVVDSIGTERKREVIGHWFDPAADIEDVPKMYYVDPDETTSFLVHREIPKSTRIVIYTAIVSSDDRVVWQDAESISNEVAESK